MSERELSYRLTIGYAVFFGLMQRMGVKAIPSRALDVAELLHAGY